MSAAGVGRRQSIADAHPASELSETAGCVISTHEWKRKGPVYGPFLIVAG